MPAKTMAVNVSGVQFQSGDFLDGLFAALSKTGLDPEFLELDVTESVLMHHPERTAFVLKTLRDRGVQVSVDNFGTGNSSLSSMQKLPAQCTQDRPVVRPPDHHRSRWNGRRRGIHRHGSEPSPPGHCSRELKRLKIWSFCGHTIVTKPRGTFSAGPFRRISWPSCSNQTEPARCASRIEMEIVASETKPSRSDTHGSFATENGLTRLQRCSAATCSACAKHWAEAAHGIGRMAGFCALWSGN